MTDKQQIEEMGQILFDTVEDAVTFKQTSLLGGRVSTDCYKFAKALYNENYRKVPENAVVLTREEYDNMFSFKTTRGGFYNILDTVREAQSQETANEIFTKLIEVAKNNDNKISIGLLKAWAIEYGVEVK